MSMKNTVVYLVGLAEPSFMRNSWWPWQWLSIIEKVRRLAKLPTVETLLRLKDLIRLNVPMAKEKMCIGCLVASIIVVDVLIGTAFIEFICTNDNFVAKTRYRKASVDSLYTTLHIQCKSSETEMMQDQQMVEQRFRTDFRTSRLEGSQVM